MWSYRIIWKQEFYSINNKFKFERNPNKLKIAKKIITVKKFSILFIMTKGQYITDKKYISMFEQCINSDL